MKPFALFAHRVDAGRRLADELMRFRGQDTVVLGLPRGGVVVAYQVARTLEAPLDVCIVRKIGAPMHPELGIGAVAEEGTVYVDRSTLAVLGVSERALAKLIESKRREVEQRIARFRGAHPAVDVQHKTVLVVDDGIATGGTARAAIQTLRARGASRVVLAVPVGAADTLEDLASVADEVVCPHSQEALWAVGAWYEDFTPTSDDEVVELLARARSERAEPPRSAPAPTPFEQDVRIPLGTVSLEGRLTIPPDARGIVLFAHGSGSSRHSLRNRFVAGELQREGLATLLFDLLTETEETIDARTGHLRFDIDMLACRLAAVTDWVRLQAETKALPVGYFGSSTGAAAAVAAASERVGVVRALVLRGGRPDLASRALGHVAAPTLLLVGGRDPQVLELNREAFDALRAVKKLEIVPAATHLFEEPGALEHVAHSAASWFAHHLGGHRLRATA